MPPGARDVAGSISLVALDSNGRQLAKDTKPVKIHAVVQLFGRFELDKNPCVGILAKIIQDMSN